MCSALCYIICKNDLYKCGKEGNFALVSNCGDGDGGKIMS